MEQQQQEALNRARKNAPSRETCEEVRRIGLALDGDDEALLLRLAEYLLDVRQGFRGGRRNLRGSRHWSDV